MPDFSIGLKRAAIQVRSGAQSTPEEAAHLGDVVNFEYNLRHHGKQVEILYNLPHGGLLRLFLDRSMLMSFSCFSQFHPLLHPCHL